MALSKPSFLTHLKTLIQPHHHLRGLRCSSPPSFLSLRPLSFATPEDAAADRRRRKRRLRIEPPISPLHRSQTQQQPPKPQNPNPNPNAPKLPEPVSALSGNRLSLHNKILTLIRRNDLDEAALYTRHSIYSNCRPTIFTVNAVLAAQLLQSKYSDLLSLHRFITQAGVAANIVTHNLIFQTYLDCCKPDTAMEHYKQLVNDAPLSPSPTTYRILIKGLVDNDKLERAFELKEEIDAKGLFDADATVYHHLMTGSVRNSDPEGVFRLYEELKAKSGDVNSNSPPGVVVGSLMKGYLMKGMEKEAMECYEEAMGREKKMIAVAYNSVLEAFTKHGKFNEAVELFERMKGEHCPPRRFTVNLGSFNVMVDGYCAHGRFKEAVEVFRKMGEYRCGPDTLSFNNLIQHFCSNDLLSEAEEVCGEMGEKGVNPDEFTYSLLMDTCFAENRADDAAEYFRKMVDAKLRPNLAVYGRLVDGLVKVGKVDEAKSFFDLMGKKLKMDVVSYQYIMKALSDAGKFDEVINVVDTLLEDEWIELNEELQEFIKGELRKDGREDALEKMIEEKERLKAEAKAKEIEEAEAAKRSRSAAVSSLLPASLFGKKGTETEAAEKAGQAETAPAADVKSTQEGIISECPDETGSKSEGANEQVVA